MKVSQYAHPYYITLSFSRHMETKIPQSGKNLIEEGGPPFENQTTCTKVWVFVFLWALQWGTWSRSHTADPENSGEVGRKPVEAGFLWQGGPKEASPSPGTIDVKEILRENEGFLAKKFWSGQDLKKEEFIWLFYILYNINCISFTFPLYEILLFSFYNHSYHPLHPLGICGFFRGSDYRSRYGSDDDSGY